MAYDQILYNGVVYNGWYEVNLAAAQDIIDVVVAELADLGILIYPYHRPQTIIPPTITYAIVQRNYVENLFGSIGIATMVVDFTIYSYLFSEVVELNDVLRDTLEAFKGTRGQVEVMITTSQGDRTMTTVDLNTGAWVYQVHTSYEFRYRLHIPYKTKASEVLLDAIPMLEATTS